MTLRSTTSTCLEEGCAPCETGSLNTGEALLEVPDSRFVLAERVLETLRVGLRRLGAELSDGGLGQIQQERSKKHAGLRLTLKDERLAFKTE